MPYIETNGINTYYKMKGRGPPLVFIHGLANRQEAWNQQVDYFSDKFNVITYDIRGHGRSEGNEEEYSIKLFADDLHKLLWKLKIENPIICGLSMGGMIAQIYATKHPTKLLILADTFRSGKVTELTKYLPRETIERIATSTPIDVFFGIANFIISDAEKSIKEKIKTWFEEMDAQQFRKVLLACYGFEKIDTSKIHSPTLIILGEKETPITRVNSKNLRDNIRGAKLFKIKNSIHISNLENPTEFNTLLNLFFTENL